VRQHLLAQRPEVGWIAEHLAHLDGQIVEQARQHGGIVQDRSCIAEMLAKPSWRRACTSRRLIDARA
jgi:hypothetical protein